MILEQFLFTYKNGEGMRIYQSRNVEKLLREESLVSLIELGKYETKETVKINKFETEQVVAYTCLKPIFDEHERRIMQNHTILAKYDDIFTHFQKTVEPHFFDGLGQPDKLEPITIEA